MPPQTDFGGRSPAAAKTYTWQEVAKHNSAASCWIYVGDKVYDITAWLDRHPGGKEHLLLAAGRDCTDLFPSYHPFTDKPEAVLRKFEIGTIVEKEFPQYKPDTGFYRDVRKRVGKYFEENNLDPKDPVPGLVRLAFIMATAYVTFVALCDPDRHWAVRAGAALVFGACQALSLLHTMHDASHTSIGSSPWHWRVWGRLTMDWFAGADMTSWHNQHVVGHHVYTNVVGADPDLPVEMSGDIRRVAPQQLWSFVYKFQHVYLLVLYGLLGLKFRVQDVVGVLSAQNGPIRVNITDFSEHWWLLATKAFWVAWRIAVPLYVWGVPSGSFWALFFVSEFTTGYFLAFNFQVSHVSPSAVFPDITSSFEDEWGPSQVKTTVDYDHGNAVMTFLCGALNYQTVHHLFPSVSQYHYPALAPIVLEVCNEYNVPYTIIPTFWQAFGLHIKHLRDMGESDAIKKAL